jgi:FixJ family two-component response regulator
VGKTILMTGGDINISKEQIKKLGIDNFIRKPFGKEELTAAIKEVFKER